MTGPTYTAQRQAIEHAIALLESGARAGTVDAPPAVIDAMKAGALSIGVLERFKDVANLLVALQRDAPDLFCVLSEICAAFPGAKLVRISDGQ